MSKQLADTEFATVRLSRAQLQAIYEKLYPDYRAELLSGVEGQKASPLALAFVKIAEAWSGLDAERTIQSAIADTERLDWLNGRLNWFTTQGGAFNPTHKNIREAIDAARAADPEAK